MGGANNPCLIWIVTKAIYFVMLVFVLGLVILSTILIDQVLYSDFYISDWMINYEGGFVRRGLIGQGLLWIYENVGCYSLKRVILAISIVSAVVFGSMVWKVSKDLKITIFPLMVTLCGAMGTVTWYRRDFIELTIVAVVFWICTKWLKERKECQLLVANMLMVIAILMHEGTFFFMVPLLILVVSFADNNSWISWNKVKAIFKVGLIPTITMATTSVFKGTNKIATTIWDSWMPAMKCYPDRGETSGKIGDGVAFLSNSTMDAINLHLKYNFQVQEHNFFLTLWCILSLLLMMTIMYYIIIKNPHVDSKCKSVTIPEGHFRMGNMLLIQYLMMLPMLTVLSCDYGRTIMYCTVSVIVMEFALRKNEISVTCPKGLGNTSKLVCKWFNKKRIGNSGWLYLACVVMFPISKYCYIHFPNDCLAIRIVSMVITKLSKEGI